MGRTTSMAGFLAFVTCSPPSRRDKLTNDDSLDIIGFTNILQQSTPLTLRAASLKSTGLVLSLELLACLITRGREVGANVTILS